MSSLLTFGEPLPGIKFKEWDREAVGENSGPASLNIVKEVVDPAYWGCSYDRIEGEAPNHYGLWVQFDDYGVTVFLYRTPYLVDIVKQKEGRVLMLNSIQAGNSWKDMDLLVFNSWHWWTHTGSSQPWDYIQDGQNLVKDMDRLDAFYKGLTTWARWVDNIVDTTKTKVFFQGISPTHYKGKEWNSQKKNCLGELQPLAGSSYPGGEPPAVSVVNRVLSTIKKPVYLLDITTLSQLRKDAHPSTYSNAHSGTDCSHWCLPGLPDTWNQLLYAALVM